MAQIFGSFQGPRGTVYQNHTGVNISTGDVWFDHANADIKIYNGSEWTEVGTGSGATGYTGSQGDQGIIGFTGSQGDQGVVGFTGSSGAEDATLQSVTTNGNTTTTTIFATTSGQHEGNVASRDGSANVLDIGSANDGSDATITADVTGDVVGDLTGDVTSTGTSSFSGTIDAVGGQIMGNIDGDVRTRTGSHKIVDVGAIGDGTDSEINIHDINVAGTLTSDDITSTSISIDGDMLVTGDTVMTGNLTVNGETTIINSNTITSGDALIVLNADLPSGQAPSLDSGLEINRGSSANVQILWVEGSDYFALRDVNNIKQDLVIGNLTSTGIDDNATSTAITLGSTGRVTIDPAGSSQSTHELSVREATSPRITIDDIAGTTTDVNAGLLLRYGTTNAGSMSFGGDANLDLVNNLAGSMTFATNSVERMRIDSAGNVGIGTSSPANYVVAPELVVDTGTAGGMTIVGSGGTGSYGGLYFADGVGGDAYRGFIQYNHDNSGSTDDLIFGTASAEKMRIDSTGNVGIGTTTPSQILEIRDQAPRLRITDTDTAGTSGIEFADSAGTVDVEIEVGNSTQYFAVKTAGTEAMRIDSTGNVGIGTTSPAGKQHTALATSHTWGAAWSAGTAGFGGAGSTNGALGISYNDTDGAVLGAIAPGVAWKPVDILGSELSFSIAGAEKMRVDSSGVLLVDRTSAYSDGSIGEAILQCGGLVGARSGMACIQDSTAAVVAIGFVNPNGTVGSIITTGTTTAYNTSSDYRLKENVVNLNNATDRLNQIPVHRFNFIADPDTTVDGFIAHEVQDVVPEAIVGNKDEVDDEGSPVYQGIDQSKLVPLLTAALQEAVTRIETLETEVAALKGA